MGCVNGKNAEKIEEKQVKIWYCTDTERDTDEAVAEAADEYGVRTTPGTIEEEGEEEEEI